MFDDINQAPSAFEGLGDEYSVENAPIIPKSQENRLASMATLTSSFTIDSSVFDQLEKTTDAYKNMIRLEGEESLRQRKDLEQREKRGQALLSLRKEPESQGMEAGIDAVLEDVFTRSRANSTALEEDFLDSAETLSEVADYYNDFLENEHETFGERSRRIQINRLIWQNEIDKVWAEREERPWGYGALDLVLQAIPLRVSMSKTGATGKEGIWANIFAGGAVRRSNEVFNTAIEDMTPQQFQEFSREMASRLKEQADLLGYDDKTLYQELLNDLDDPAPAWITNSFNMLDNVTPFIPASKLSKFGKFGLKGLDDLPTNLADDLAEDGLKVTTKVSDKAQEGLPSFKPPKTALEVEELSVRPTSPVITTINSAGGRSVVSDLVTQAVITSEREGIDKGLELLGSSFKGDIYGSLLPSSLNPWGKTTTVSVGSDVSDNLEQAFLTLKELTESSGDFLPSDRLDTAERITAREAAQKKLRERFDRRKPIKDISIETEELVDGTKVEKVTALLGTKDGRLYATEKTAKRALKNLLGGDEAILEYVEASDVPKSKLPERRVKGEVIQDESGGWALKTSMPVKELGFFSSPLQMKASNIFSRLLLSAGISSDERLVYTSVKAGAKQQRLIKEVMRKYEQVSAKTPGKDRKAVAQIWQKGNNNAEWYDRGEFNLEFERLTERTDSDKAWELYRQTRIFNDIDFLIRRDNVYKELLIEGYESLTSHNLNAEFQLANGKIRSSINKDAALYDAINAQYYKAGEFTKEVPEGFVIVELKEEIKNADGWYFRQVLLEKDALEVHPLKRDQLQYQEGGHRMPKGGWFVKQAQRLEQPDGTSMLGAPRSYIAARVPSEARGWASTMEEARQLLKGYKNDLANPDLFKELTELLEGKPGYPTPRQLIDDVAEGSFNLKDPFEVVEDRQLPTAYRAKAPVELQFVDDESPDLSWSRSHGTMYYGKKGAETLKDYKGDQAPTMDMHEVMSRSLNNIAKLSSFGDYKIEAVNRFYESYKTLLDSPADASPMKVLLEGRPIRGLKRSDIDSLESQRGKIKRTLGFPTREDLIYRSMQRQLIAFVDNLNPSAGRQLAKATESWNTSSPVSTLRSVAFDMKLGLFNVAQFPLQVSTLAATFSLDPTNAGRAFMNIGPSLSVMWAKKPEEVIDVLIQRGFHKTLGFDDPKEYKQFMMMQKRSGFFDIGNNQLLIGEYSPSAALSTLGKKTQQIREGARFFFYQAERFNRHAAALIAWKDIRKRRPNLDPSSPEFSTLWVGRTDDFSMNMARESASAWQSGLASIPTQFWSYSVRMMEAMLGPKFTTEQKIRLLVGQTVLYGQFGVPAASLAAYAAEKVGLISPDGERAQLGSLEAFYQRGLLDHMINWTTGLDLKASERVGVGGFPEQLVRMILNDGKYGDTSIAGAAGGATLSIVGDLFGDSAYTFKYLLAESGRGGDFTATREGLLRMATNISSVSNFYKARMVQKYGTYYTNTGAILATDLPDEYAFWIALTSYQPGAVDDIGEYYDYLADDDKAVKELTKIILNYRSKIIADPDNAFEYYDDMRHLMMLEEPHIRTKAQRAAGDFGLDSIIDELEKSTQKEKLRRELSQQLEEREK